MGSRAGVGWRVPATLLREGGRESLVEALDRHVDCLLQQLNELLRRSRLLSTGAAHRQRQSHDDSLDPVLTDELGDSREAVLSAGPLDHFDGSSDRAGGVGDGNAGARRAEVEGEDLQRSAEAISLLPTS